MRPLVSFLTPVYNGLPYLKDFVTCIMVQDYRPLEWIVVDDGSTDGSYEFLQEKIESLEKADIQVKLLRIKHKGQAAAMNAALKEVEGEFMTWCDCDDLITSDNVSKKVRYLLTHKDIGMVRNNFMILLNTAPNRVSSSCATAEECVTKNIFDDLYRAKTYAFAGCYMVRSSLLFACYPDREMPFSVEEQNYQLLFPPASRTKCGYIPDILYAYCHREGSHSLTKRTFAEKKKRIQNYAQLRLDLLPFCEVDQDYYKKVNEEVAKEFFNYYLESLGSLARKQKEEKK